MQETLVQFRLGRCAGEGTGYPVQQSWASLVAQLVKNLPAMWETWVRSLGWEDPLEKGKAMFCLSAHQLMDIWVVYTFLDIMNTTLNVPAYKCLCGHIFSFLWDIYLGKWNYTELTSCPRFLSFSIMLLKFMDVTTCVNILFIFIIKWY